MVYILGRDGRDEDVVSAFNRYRQYLASVKTSFPPSAYDLATSDWYFDPSNHRCPHDAWLEKFELFEVSDGTPNKNRTLSLKVRLRAAYHDGYIELHYLRVIKYRLFLDDGTSGHRDWRYDELRLSDSGHLVHEIEWQGAASTGVWIIEASDVRFCWEDG